MPTTMLTTLALFALFAIGSAKIDCHANGAAAVPCITAGGLIGECDGVADNQKCKVDAQCDAGQDGRTPCAKRTSLIGRCAEVSSNQRCKSVEVACVGASTSACIKDTGLLGMCDGSGTCTLDTCTYDNQNPSTCGASIYRGQCVSGGHCQYTDSVKVSYAVKTVSSDNGQMLAFLNDDSYLTTLENKMGYSVTCDVPTSLTKPTNAKSLVCTTHSCTLVCNENYTKKDSNKECVKGEWKGSYGTCVLSCPLTGGTFTDTVSRMGEFRFTNVVSGGVIICPDVFNDTLCKLSCPGDSNHVKVETSYKCAVSAAGNGKWAATSSEDLKGSCGPSPKSVPKTANLKLGLGEDHEKITNNKDEVFNAKFRQAVFESVPQVISPENVVITGIKLVHYGGRRRLNAKTIQVGYEILVGDPEGATELGAGLRGIR